LLILPHPFHFIGRHVGLAPAATLVPYLERSLLSPIIMVDISASSRDVHLER